MKTIRFKTSINCGHCVRTVSSLLDGRKGIKKWEVDVNSPDKILDIVAVDETISEDIIQDLGKLGFSAVELK